MSREAARAAPSTRALRSRLSDAARPAGGADRGRRARRAGALRPARARGQAADRRAGAASSPRRPFTVDAEALEPGDRRARRVGRVARLVGHTEAMLQRIESFIREHGPDRARRRGHLPRLRRAPTRPASGTRSASSATASRRSTSPTACAAPSPTRTRASAARPSAPRSWLMFDTPGPTEAELRDLRYSVATDRLRATGHTASDQVESVLLGLVASRHAAADQGEARGRRRPAAARSLARGDARLLRGARAPLPRRLVQSRHEARPDPGRDPAAAGAARPARARVAARARGRAAAAAARARAHARRAARRP